MSVLINDRRSEDQKRELTMAVVGTDPAMSGWGQASGCVSYAAWACKPDDVETVKTFIKRRRPNIKRLRVVRINHYRPKGDVHLSIYPVIKTHPALQSEWRP